MHMYSDERMNDAKLQLDNLLKTEDLAIPFPDEREFFRTLSSIKIFHRKDNGTYDKEYCQFCIEIIHDMAKIALNDRQYPAWLADLEIEAKHILTIYPEFEKSRSHN